jgi:hypothetical protein
VKYKVGTNKEYEAEEDIPEPFKLNSLKDYFKFLIGPGIIAMGLGLGTGELISGPYLVVRHGPFILWIALISIFLQTITSISASKYTILTGEPFQIGLNRLWLGNKLWTAVWVIMGTISTIFPYYMALLGTTFVAMIIGGVPGLEHQPLWVIFSFVALAMTLIPLLLGKKVMRTLGLMFFLIHFCIVIPLLIVLTIVFVPAGTILEVFTGFFTFGFIPADADWLAMGAVAGFAGLAASAGMSISAYYRDTGWGMSQKLGYIPGMLGGKKVDFKVRGYQPKVSPENKKRAKKWYKYISYELFIIFFLGSVITMLFPCALYYYFVESSAATEEIFGFAAVLADSLIVVLPIAFWIIIIMFFLVFWADGTGVIDGIMRQFSNVIWNSFPRLHKKFKGDIRPVYYGILGIFTALWIIMIIVGTPPLNMVLYTGSLANISGIIFAIGLLGVNYKLLPKQYRFSMMEVIVIIFALVFYSFFIVNFVIVSL